MEKIKRIFIFLFLSLSAFSNEGDFQSDYSDRLMLVRTDYNLILHESILAFEKEGRWFFPVEEFFSSLGISITISSENKKAEGFILNEQNTYSIDFEKCEYSLGGNTHKFSCNEYFEDDSEFFLTYNQIEKILPIRFQINSLKSEVFIIPLEELPPIAKKKRERKQASEQRDDNNFPLVKTKRDWLDGLNFDQDLSYRVTKNRNQESKKSLIHETSLSAEVLKSELYTNYRGLNEKTDAWWLSLERTDHRARIFGDLGLTELKLHHFNSSSLRIVGGSRKIRGVYFTNRPLNTPTTFTTQDFTGRLEAGWEVELYHNDNFLGREVSASGKDRYEFLGINLYYGVNTFHFIFYGPRGEVKHKYQKLQIDDTFNTSNDFIISAAAGIDENHNSYHFAEIGSLLSKRLLLEANTSRYTIDRDTFYHSIGLTTFVDGLVLSSHFAIDDQENYAYEVNSKLSAFNTTSNLTYTKSFSFKSDLIGKGEDLDEKYKLIFLSPLPFFRNLQFYSDIEYKELKDRSDTFNQVYRLSYSLGRFYLSNSFEVKNSVFSNEVFFRYSWLENQWKLSSNISREGINDLEFGVTWKRYKDYTYSFDYNYEIEEKISGLTARVDKMFKFFSLGTSANIDSKENLSIALNGSYGLLVDEDLGAVVVNEGISEYGNIKLNAFIDTNENGVRDSGEEGLAGVELRKLVGRDITKTNKSGLAYFSLLTAHRPNDFKVSMKDIENIYLKTSLSEFKIWPRPGKTTEILCPVTVQGDVEGEIVLNHDKDRAELKFFKNNKLFKTMKADRDGYFMAQGLTPGNYELEISCNNCNGEILRKSFEMPSDGDSLYLEDLNLRGGL